MFKMGAPAEPASDGFVVLLVDDDPTILAFLQRALETTTTRVAVAQSGAQALALLQTQPFDAIVSDIQMPGMSGLKLLHAVREHDLDLPVVLITGHPDLKSAAAAVEYGAFQYLIKPVAVDRLRAVVERAVNVAAIARLKRTCAEEFGSGSFYVGDRASIELKLNRALRSLWMAYQPIVQASSGALFAHEALLRCDEPLLLTPAAILKAAEKVRRLHDVGRAIRELVAVEAAQAPDELLTFVNLHTEDLMDPALYLPNAPLSRVARRIVLEFTDRASLESVSDVVARIARLRALGFRIAIDDLGVSQADPNTFAQLEPEFVKLDMSIIRAVDRDPGKKKIVQSMVRACHNIGKVIIAEGVETAGERDTLLTVGCDLLQGYLFGRPEPREALPVKRTVSVA